MSGDSSQPLSRLVVFLVAALVAGLVAFLVNGTLARGALTAVGVMVLLTGILVARNLHRRDPRG